ncbi:type II toxin-antitoxin system VapC family toxin [Candidatus Thiosymbion oneisti]|uniref:type II toxin-antitoxin system VapC family toxin n=1 Tax=Candidatus Thiosymbion oneisti TaxID=589554 RepID=UPI000B7D4492|nr:PIN domain-containing protein [Candidatus Thiosymbion oneisti]
MGLTERLSSRRVYFDTNIVIYLVEGFIDSQSVINELQDLLSINDCEAVTSELTLCESLIQPFKIESAEGITIYRSFLEESGVFDPVAPSRDIFVQAAFLAGTTAMKIPDAIHVATALESKCEMMLTNDKKMRTTKELEKILLSDYQ